MPTPAIVGLLLSDLVPTIRLTDTSSFYPHALVCATDEWLVGC
jgi:hypothetical protein